MASPSPAFLLPFVLPFDPKLFGGFLCIQKPDGLVVHLVASMNTLEPDVRSSITSGFR